MLGTLEDALTSSNPKNISLFTPLFIIMQVVNLLKFPM